MAGGETVAKLEEALKKCLELGKLIAQTDEYKEFKQAEYNLMQDAEARKMLEDLQIMQQEQEKKRMTGVMVTPEERQKLQQAEKACLKNPIINASHNTNSKFHLLMNKISTSIKEGIKGKSELDEIDY